MRFLLDTCVVSELISRNPTAAVVRWIDETDEDSLYLSAITIGEINRGIQRLPSSKRKQELRRWLDDELLNRFGSRILALDAQAMLTWGSMVAALESSGRILPAMDSMIAALANHHELTLVTRNEKDFADMGIGLHNPWLPA